MSYEEDIKKMIAHMQTSLHDQVSALKEDVSKAIGDSGAALELSAELEKSINSLSSEKGQLEKQIQMQGHISRGLLQQIEAIQIESKKARVIAVIDGICFDCSIQLSLYFSASGDYELRSLIGERMLELLFERQQALDKIGVDATNDEIKSTLLKFVDGLSKIRQELGRKDIPLLG